MIGEWSVRDLPDPALRGQKTKLKENIEMRKDQNKVTFIAYGAVIAALYVVLTLPFASFALGVVQFRFAEALTILPYFTPAAIPGLTIGCFLANLLSGAAALDVVFGSLATLIGACLSYLLCRNKCNYHSLGIALRLRRSRDHPLSDVYHWSQRDCSRRYSGKSSAHGFTAVKKHAFREVPRLR